MPARVSNPSRGHLILLVAVALGALLIVASALPGQALRPEAVYQVVVVHRVDLALVGFAIVFIIGALYLFAG
jgi:hypothetical protein